MMPVYEWDVRWLLWVQRSTHSAAFQWTLKQAAQYGDWIWLALLGVILVLDRRRGKLVCLIGITAWGFSSYIGDTLLKPLLKHPRPFSVPSLAPQIRLLIPAPSSLSFPSSAAAVSFAVAGVIAYFYSGRKALAVLLLASLIAYSEIYAGVHFPSDAIGGAVMGSVVAIMEPAVAVRWWRQAQAAPPKPARAGGPPK